MNNPCFIVDLKPTYALMNDGYTHSGVRLISSFTTYLELIMNMYKAIHNSTGDDELLIDHYIHGSYHKVSEADERTARKTICEALDSLLMLTNIHGAVFPGKIRNIFIEYTACIMVIEYGGEHDTA